MCSKVTRENNVFKRVIRDMEFSLDIKTEECVVGSSGIKFNARTEYDDKNFQLVLAIIENDDFAAFYECGTRLKTNEEKIEKEILTTKYADAYGKLQEEMMKYFKKYFYSCLNGPWHRFSKIWLKEYFESKEFLTKLKVLEKNVSNLIDARDFDSIPSLIESSELLKEIYDKDFMLGNYQIDCTENNFITNIKWCSANCDKFSNCPIWSKMKEEDEFNYNLNQEFLAS